MHLRHRLTLFNRVDQDALPSCFTLHEKLIDVLGSSAAARRRAGVLSLLYLDALGAGRAANRRARKWQRFVALLDACLRDLRCNFEHASFGELNALVFENRDLLRNPYQVAARANIVYNGATSLPL